MVQNKAGLTTYTSGDYFSLNISKHRLDSQFKAQEFLKLILPHARERGWELKTYADVGCGSGDAARKVANGLKANGFNVVDSIGYEISPRVEELQADDTIRFVCSDFAQDGEHVDLVTLFDVFEHVPEPIEFLRNVAERCKWIGLHIPLDNNVNNSVRNLYLKKLHTPGHLVFLDVPQALTLLALSGIRVVTYQYTFHFEWPSGQQGALAKLAVFPRRLLAKISPWLTSRILGGCSLMVIGETKASWAC